MKKFAIAFLGLMIAWQGAAWACESCLVTVLGRRDGVAGEAKQAKRVFFDFMFEQQNWNELDPMDAHELHHDGHHIHNKTHEEFYHFQLGFNPHEQVTVLANIPYVARESIHAHSHSRVGERESSEGFGDLHLIGVWRFIQNADGFLGLTGGVKFPTGSTSQKDRVGSRFDAELQPGSGSYDYPVGGVFKYAAGAVAFTGNAVYVVKTEGDQNYEFGDVFTVSLVTDWAVNPDSKSFRTRIGLDLNFQHEEKHVEDGLKIADSGGDTLFAGPALTIDVNENSLIYGTFLFPVSQNMGGVHQEMDFTWTVGARISW